MDDYRDDYMNEGYGRRGSGFCRRDITRCSDIAGCQDTAGRQDIAGRQEPVYRDTGTGDAGTEIEITAGQFVKAEEPPAPERSPSPDPATSAKGSRERDIKVAGGAPVYSQARIPTRDIRKDRELQPGQPRELSDEEYYGFFEKEGGPEPAAGHGGNTVPFREDRNADLRRPAPEYDTGSGGYGRDHRPEESGGRDSAGEEQYQAGPQRRYIQEQEPRDREEDRAYAPSCIDGRKSADGNGGCRPAPYPAPAAKRNGSSERYLDSASDEWLDDYSRKKYGYPDGRGDQYRPRPYLYEVPAEHQRGGKIKVKSRIRPGHIIAAALAVLTVVIFILAFRSCGSALPSPAGNAQNILQDEKQQQPGIRYDSSAKQGGWDQTDRDRIVDELNAKVDEGMINISMNTSPYFQDGFSEGNLMIVNESINRYPQVVEIKRNDTGETVYKSDAIPVGSRIETAKLSSYLPMGTYECTALFYNVDPSTGSYLGCAGAIISLTVLN